MGVELLNYNLTLQCENFEESYKQTVCAQWKDQVQLAELVNGLIQIKMQKYVLNLKSNRNDDDLPI